MKLETTRLRIDATWSDVAEAIGFAMRPARDVSQATEELERSFCDHGVAALSLRSGLDALLTAMAWPQGSEIVLTAINIPHMPMLIAGHGLIPVPIDIDPRTTAPSIQDLERAITPRTKAIMVAHLYGGRAPMGAVMSVARGRGLMVLEDCAQTFDGSAWRGTAGADVTMFSFGSIKTATAFGGALMRFADSDLAAATRRVRDAQPAQTQLDFLRAVLLGACFKAIESPGRLSMFASALALFGKDFDTFLNESSRQFTNGDFFELIRRRPSPAQVDTLAARLTRTALGHVARRRGLGERILEELPNGVYMIGEEAEGTSWWLLPVVVPDPEVVVRSMRDAGIDATRGRSSLRALEPPSPRPASLRARDAMEHMIYLPRDPSMPDDTLKVMQEILRHAGRDLCE
ncbi:MAG: DegT/DnrJ/EryC1/StrS family aminotransferase [Myxococcota bacterium]